MTLNFTISLSQRPNCRWREHFAGRQTIVFKEKFYSATRQTPIAEEKRFSAGRRSILPGGEGPLPLGEGQFPVRNSLLLYGNFKIPAAKT